MKASIVRYSHHFTVSGFSNAMLIPIYTFVRGYQAYQKFFVKGKGMISKPTKVFAESNASRTVIRLHINQYDDFMTFMEQNNYSEDSFTISDIEMYVPAPAAFKMNEKFEAREYQVPMIDYLKAEGNNKLLTLQTGRGKAQPLDARIKVPGGWDFMSNMEVGKKVTTPDGSSANVIGVYPQGEKDIYRVTFADGRSTECCLEHLWKVYRPNRSWSETGKVVDTKEMIRLLSLSNNRLYIDLCDSEKTDDVELPIDPWLLGVLIGDGCFRATSPGLTTSKPFILEKVKSKLPDGLILTKGGEIEYRIVRKSMTMKRNPLTVLLEDLNLNNKLSHQKFLPEIYKNASSEQRHELLRGLIDSDGYVSPDSTINYSTSSIILASDLVDLVRSIGGMAFISERLPTYTYKGNKLDGRISYNVNIRLASPKSACTLPEKATRAKIETQYTKGFKLRVRSVEFSRRAEAQCIAIDSEDRLYVTDDYIVTHNTFCALQAIADLGLRAVLVVPAKYVDKWIDDVRDAYGDKIELMVIQGGKSLRIALEQVKEGCFEADFTIISATTLYNYYKEYKNEGVFTYAVKPMDMLPMMGAGIRLIDEAHENLHLNFRQDLYCHCYKNISLSATVETRGDELTQRVLEVMYPRDMRPPKLEYIKYVNVFNFNYGLKNRKGLKYKRMKMYSHSLYEEWIMADQERLDRYLDMITSLIEDTYVKKNIKGQKILVFAASVELCRILAKECERKWPDLLCSTKVAGDEFSVLEEADIICSTVISTGTAVDIYGLSTVILTTALNAYQKNLQVLGRLRELKGEWVGQNPVMVYLTCTDVDKHVEYHKEKEEAFKGRALTHQSIFSKFRI